MSTLKKAETDGGISHAPTVYNMADLASVSKQRVSHDSQRVNTQGNLFKPLEGIYERFFSVGRENTELTEK